MNVSATRNYRSKIVLNCHSCDVHPFKPNIRTITINEIIRKSVDFIGIPLDKLQSKCRELHLVDGRRLLVGILYYDMTYRLTKREIGKFLGNRDHGTVINLLNTLRKICDTEEPFRQRYYDLHMHVYGHDKNFKF